ncbi:hypothetical protein ASG25_03825 [Rhizobium sp. Leaf384]|uniref:hypothetical protein n=1 Tax=unclassified Rhizobium TaxID=2613769 RepID=UPI0007157C97|nr:MULTISPECIES: hypothetical protein [unclassified Rhizobium]KQS77399.1 hypothetical protein ASG58_10500 [Rhizobium sp. Leaf383]KQS80693.1 hypothetical protein ASG25_03825 [Rhizobium sp. Leaf384]
MVGHTVSRIAACVGLLALGGCNTPDTGGAIEAGGSAASATPAVIQAACPQVVMRDATSVYRTYAKGAKDDPTQIVYQASLADSTRQCVQSDTTLTVNVVVQGRVTSGPAGGPGTINLPIRVTASDGDNTLFSDVTQLPVTVAAGAGAQQFIFTKSAPISGGAGNFAKVYVGFDTAPTSSKKKK